MQKNDFIELRIEDIADDGAGIGRFQGMIYFVKDTVIGDLVSAKIIKQKKTYGYARLIEIKEASPIRVEPRCLYARSCGGCQIQQMDYPKQLEFKEKKIKNDLVRIGGFEEEFINEVMEPIVGMEEPFAYRNKAQFPIGKNAAGEIVAGFYAGRTHNIIANTDCVLGMPENKIVLKTVLSYMKKYGVSAYDEKTKSGLVRHVLIRYGFDSKESMVCIVINGKRLPAESALIERLSEIKGMKSISVNSNLRDTNVILGDCTRTIWGADFITDALYLRNTQDFSRTGEKTVYRISPKSFYQVNPLQTEKLYSLALEYAGLTGEEVVWDLYCGIGTISLFLARRAKWVYGVEVVPEAVEDAKENARLNGIANAAFLTGKAEEVLQEKEAEEIWQRADVIVVDPPRKGCDPMCLETMIKMAPERIVYVSCDSATLARDLRYLTENGYEVRRGRCCDMFGGTVHTETVCLLSKLLGAKHHIEVNVDMDELDLTSSEAKATYEDIKKYVAENNDGMRVTNLYIAQMKQKHGIIERMNYNLPKSENPKQLKCPEEKVRAIEDALRHFQMI